MTDGDEGAARLSAKEQTRQRLLAGALAILDEEGEARLSTTNVARRAGVAQSTFYVHFSDMDHLLLSLLQQLRTDLSRASHEVQEEVRRTSSPAAVRDLFRSRLMQLVAHPAVLRIVVRSRLDPAGPLGDYTRGDFEATRSKLVATMAEAGAAHSAPEERHKLAMQAEGLLALLESLALGHVEGRYRDIDEILDVLVRFAETLRPRSRSSAGQPHDQPV